MKQLLLICAVVLVGCGKKVPAISKECEGTEHLSDSELHKELYGEEIILTPKEFSVKCADCHSRDY